MLRRDNWWCQTCGRYGNQVDHVQPLHKGGASFDEANLQMLCRGCHIEKTASENRRPSTPAEAAWAAFVRELLPG